MEIGVIIFGVLFASVFGVLQIPTIRAIKKSPSSLRFLATLVILLTLMAFTSMGGASLIHGLVGLSDQQFYFVMAGVVILNCVLIWTASDHKVL